MKVSITSRVWTWVILSLPVPLTLWSGHLIVSVVREQEQARQYVNLVQRLEDLKRAIRQTGDCVLIPPRAIPGVTQEARRAQAYANYHEKLKNVPVEQVAALGFDRSLARVESAVERLRSMARVASTAPAGGAPPGELIADARRAENAAVRAVDGMVQTAREHRRVILQQLSMRWGSLTLIVLGSCLLAVLVVLLLYSYRLSAAAQKRAEAERDRFFALSGDMLCIAGFDGYFKQLSPSWEKTLGYPVRRLLERPHVGFVHPDDRAETLAESNRLTVNNATPNFENRYRCQSGGYRWLRWTATADIKRKLIYATARDVTDLKQAQMELEDFATRLGRSNRELEDFASVASHDLQEPLRKVLAFGDRLKATCADALSAQGHDYLERMQGAAGRMQTLIRDLLAFSRVTTQAQPFVSVDLARVTRDVLSDLEVRIEELGAQVTVANLPTIDADPLQMRQLVQNLIGNALKFHRPNERPVVRVYAEMADAAERPPAGAPAPAAQVRLVVEDNGIGFDEKYRERIFNVFQRLHGREAYEGTGIGLAICRKIVERHGGSITAHGDSGRGSVFRVTLPVEQDRRGEERDGAESPGHDGRM